MIGDRLPFILSCLKNSPLQEYHGATFGMTQPQCNAWIRLLLEIRKKSCYSEKKTHNVKNNPLCSPQKRIL
jgi:hypothetical protein